MEYFWYFLEPVDSLKTPMRLLLGKIIPLKCCEKLCDLTCKSGALEKVLSLPLKYCHLWSRELHLLLKLAVVMFLLCLISPDIIR